MLSRGRRIAMEIAKGLAYLHSKDIAHLDLKSPNILLDASDKAKIGDVGLGKICITKWANSQPTGKHSAVEAFLLRACHEIEQLYS